jgi:hypothetical protein
MVLHPKGALSNAPGTYLASASFARYSRRGPNERSHQRWPFRDRSDPLHTP